MAIDPPSSNVGRIRLRLPTQWPLPGKLRANPEAMPWPNSVEVGAHLVDHGPKLTSRRPNLRRFRLNLPEVGRSRPKSGQILPQIRMTIHAAALAIFWTKPGLVPRLAHFGRIWPDAAESTLCSF